MLRRREHWSPEEWSDESRYRVAMRAAKFLRNPNFGCCTTKHHNESSYRNLITTAFRRPAGMLRFQALSESLRPFRSSLALIQAFEIRAFLLESLRTLKFWTGHEFQNSFPLDSFTVLLFKLSRPFRNRIKKLETFSSFPLERAWLWNICAAELPEAFWKPREVSKFFDSKQPLKETFQAGKRFRIFSHFLEPFNQTRCLIFLPQNSFVTCSPRKKSFFQVRRTLAQLLGSQTTEIFADQAWHQVGLYRLCGRPLLTLQLIWFTKTSYEIRARKRERERLSCKSGSKRVGSETPNPRRYEANQVFDFQTSQITSADMSSGDWRRPTKN